MDERRSYRNWMKLAKGKNILIRHDVDYDIVTLEKMLEIERHEGIQSVSYFDIHSPSYSEEQIANVIGRFKDNGFLFGLHINTAYDYPADEAWEQYKKDVAYFKEKFRGCHSVVGHAYDSKVIKNPEYSNRDIEVASTDDPDMPDNFKKAFYPDKPPYMMSDSGGGLSSMYPVKDGRAFFYEMKPDYPSFVLLHPVHWRIDGDDVMFVKRLGGLPNTTQNIHVIQAKFRKRLTTYCQTWIENTHLWQVYNIIEHIARDNYRQYLRMVDAGCAVGLLGMYAMGINNLKYIGFDIEQEFIEVGREMYDAFGYSPDLRVNDLYDGEDIDGEIFVLAAAEDLPMDYDKIYEIAKKYEHVVMTIVTKDRYEEAKAKGKKYWYIDDLQFQEKFGKAFTLTSRYEINNRILYHLTRR